MPRPQLFVVGNQDSMGVDGTPYTKMLAETGYRVVRVIGCVEYTSASNEMSLRPDQLPTISSTPTTSSAWQ